MKIYNRYILTVAACLLLTAVLLIATGQQALDIYFTAFVIEALVITELFVYLDSNARRGLIYVSTVLFGGFLIVLYLQVVRILR